MRLAGKSPQNPRLLPHRTGEHQSQLHTRGFSCVLTPSVEDWRCDGAERFTVGISTQPYAEALRVMIQTPRLDLHEADAEIRLRLQFFCHLDYFLKADAVNKTLNWKALILFSSFSKHYKSNFLNIQKNCQWSCGGQDPRAGFFYMKL